MATLYIQFSSHQNVKKGNYYEKEKFQNSSDRFVNGYGLFTNRMCRKNKNDENNITQNTVSAAENTNSDEESTAPDKGFDNSGLIYYALTKNGISCPRLTCDIAQIGSKIKYDQLQTGDLVFFEYENDGEAHYGGIYAGNGKAAISMSDDIPVKVIVITTNYYRSNFMRDICVAR